jgi:DNA polymerase III subunit delta'
MAFPGILGHARVQGLIARALELGRVPPALLFVGPSGVGKRTVALALGRALLCETAGTFPCDACSSCTRALKGIHPDLFLVEALTKVIKIDQVRDVVREIGSRPFEGRARAFVIDDAHELTEQAANALLKSLEEPAARSHVILVTAAPQALLPTVRSRCQLIRFGPLSAALVEQQLRAVAGLDAEDAALRAAAAGGSLGAALSLESEAYRQVRDRLLVLLESAGSSGPLERMGMAQELADQEDLDGALGVLRGLLRDVAALRAGAVRLVNPDLAARLATVAKGRIGDRASLLAEVAAEAREALVGNANKLLTMDLLLEAFAR